MLTLENIPHYSINGLFSSSLVAQTPDRSVHSTEIFGRAIAAHWGANLGQKYGGNKNQDWAGGLKYKHFPVSLSNKTFP